MIIFFFSVMIVCHLLSLVHAHLSRQNDWNELFTIAKYTHATLDFCVPSENADCCAPHETWHYWLLCVTRDCWLLRPIQDMSVSLLDVFSFINSKLIKCRPTAYKVSTSCLYTLLYLRTFYLGLTIMYAA